MSQSYAGGIDKAGFALAELFIKLHKGEDAEQILSDLGEKNFLPALQLLAQRSFDKGKKGKEKSKNFEIAGKALEQISHQRSLSEREIKMKEVVKSFLSSL